VLAPDNEIDKTRICLETAMIPWRGLQKFFAAGNVYEVSSGLDLTEVALRFSRDDSEYAQALISEEKVMTVSDDKALRWYEKDIQLWAVVVKPFVLVQEK
jgi:hypothetical protein